MTLTFMAKAEKVNKKTYNAKMLIKVPWVRTNPWISFKVKTLRQLLPVPHKIFKIPIVPLIVLYEKRGVLWLKMNWGDSGGGGRSK